MPIEPGPDGKMPLPFEPIRTRIDRSAELDATPLQYNPRVTPA